MLDLAIVGGGPSGLTAAIFAKKTSPKCRVALWERHDRVGKKLLATGNGRCNLTNRSGLGGRYHGGSAFAGKVFARFGVEDTLRFMEEIGIVPVEEDDGKVYPCSLKASAVLDQLRFAAQEAGVEMILGQEVQAVRRTKQGFVLKTNLGDTSARQIIICAGGKASPSLSSDGLGYSLLKGLGHTITPLYPSLVQIKTETAPIRGLKGIKTNALVTVRACGKQKTEQGEVLFTDYGLSGPPIFQLSRAVSCASGGEVTLDLLPDKGEGWLIQELFSRRQRFARREVGCLLLGILQKRLGEAVLRQQRVIPMNRPIDSLDNSELARIAGGIKGFSIRAAGVCSWPNAQVTAGGAEVGEFDPYTLQSRLTPGLYAAGEVLDVDGDCGGFNLQWAWSSGAIAGMCAAGGIRND